MRTFICSAVLVLLGHTLPLVGQTTVFAISSPTGPVPRAEPIPFVVQARNAQGQIATDYRGTIEFIAGDPSVVVPPPHTFTESDAGAHSFSVTFNRGGFQPHNFSITDGAATSSRGVRVFCPGLTLTASNDGRCPTEPTTLTATTNASNPIFAWSSARPVEQIGAGRTYTFPPGRGSGTWLLSMTDADTGCLLNTSTTVTYEYGPRMKSPEAALGDFTASIAHDPNGPYVDMVWFAENGSVIAGQGTLTATIRPNPGKSWVRVQVTSTRQATGCRLTTGQSPHESTRIDPVPSTEITTDENICPGGPSHLMSVPDAGQGAVYRWTVSDGGTILLPHLRENSYNAPVHGDSVTLTVTIYVKGGTVTASKTIPYLDVPRAVIDGDLYVCGGGSATIPVALRGTPPFRIEWSDGVVQSDIGVLNTSRTVNLDESAAFSIVSVADANCSGPGRGTVAVVLAEAPQIAAHPESQTVPHGRTATLLIDANGIDLRYDWYEVQPDGTTSLMASGASPAFTTPPVTKARTYRVEVAGPCGTVQSNDAVVTAAGRRRSVRH